MAFDMLYNPSTEPILSGKGIVVINGVRMDEFTQFALNATITEYKFKVLYQRGYTTRPKDIDWTGTLTDYKTSPWIVQYVIQYRDTGIVPDLMLQVMQADPASKMYKDWGGQSIIIPHIQLTGELPIITADKDGEAVMETVNFTAPDIIVQ